MEGSLNTSLNSATVNFRLWDKNGRTIFTKRDSQVHKFIRLIELETNSKYCFIESPGPAFHESPKPRARETINQNQIKISITIASARSLALLFYVP
jgi:hypothetical protein